MKDMYGKLDNLLLFVIFDSSGFVHCDGRPRNNKMLAMQSNSMMHRAIYIIRSLLPLAMAAALSMSTTSLVAVEPRRPPMTDVGTETAFRLDQRKHFRKSKHLLSSEVN